MLKLLLTFSIIGFFLSGAAQSVNIEWSESIPIPERNAFARLLYEDDKYTYLVYPRLGTKKESYWLFVKLDKQTNTTVVSKKIDESGKYFSFREVYRMGGNFVFLYTDAEEKEKNTWIYYSGYQLVDEYGDLIGGRHPINALAHVGVTRFVHSDDYTKVAVAYFESYYSGNEIRIDVLDANMNRINTAVVILPDEVKNDDLKLVVTNNGTAYLAGCYTIWDKGKRSGLRYVTKQIKNNDVTELSHGQWPYQIANLNVFTDKNDVYLAGIAQGATEGTVQGLFTAKLNADGNSVKKESFMAFDAASMALIELESRTEYKTGGNGIGVVKKKPVRRMDEAIKVKAIKVIDGYVYTIAEIEFEICDWNVDLRQCNSFYVSNQIFTAITDPIGNMQKMVTVQKQQQQPGYNDFCSFLAFANGKDLCLLYNQPQIVEGSVLKVNDVLSYYWPRSVLKQSLITADGIVTTGELYRSESLKAVMNTDEYLYTSPLTVISSRPLGHYIVVSDNNRIGHIKFGRK